MANVIKTKKYVFKNVASDQTYYAKRAIRYSTISADELVDAAARNSQVNAGVIRSAMNAVLNEFHNFMLNGHSVKVPQIGIFRLSLRTRSVKNVRLSQGRLARKKLEPETL